MEKHEVKQGGCIDSIAWQFGHFPQTLWEHSANESLRKLRKDGNVLYPGDVLIIPELRLRPVTCETERRHRFRRRGVPAKLYARLMVEDEVLVGEEYEAEIDGKRHAGKTDGEGRIALDIHPQARGGWIRIHGREFRVQLGVLDPLDTVSGQQARLKQLGFYGGPANDKPSDELTEAIRAFQRHHKLTESGEADEETMGRLRSHYGV